MFATTDMVPPLAARGISLSREQVYRLVTGVPERLSLPVLAALCDILDCSPGDLIEPVRKPARTAEPAPEPAQRPGRCARGSSPGPAHGDSPLPGGHELPGGRRQAAACPQCRRDTLIRHVITVDGHCPPARPPPRSTRWRPPRPRCGRWSRRWPLTLTCSGTVHPRGRRLAAELIARGSVLAVPACARCSQDGRPLFRTPGGGMCRPAPPGCAPPPALTAARSRQSQAVTPQASAGLRAVPAACPGAPHLRALRAGGRDRGAGA